jgi:hypothetical protein
VTLRCRGLRANHGSDLHGSRLCDLPFLSAVRLKQIDGADSDGFALGIYNVDCDDAGNITDVVPFDADREPPALIRGLPEIVKSPLRISQPFIRQGYLANPGVPDPHNRGGEPFVPVSWTTTLELVARELLRALSRAFWWLRR